jgi:hypothetical protein
MTNIITGNESSFDLIRKMSEGDYDAMKAIDGLMKLGDMGAMAILFLDVDNLDIRGKDLGVFYKNICRENPQTLDSLLGAWQSNHLGGATKEAFHAAIVNAHQHRPHGLDVDRIVDAYQEKAAVA